MPSLALPDLDHSFSEAPHLRLVEEINLLPGGVDPLGLRQVNLNLMDAALPGINNVTSHVRPYSLMAWAWWKAAQVAEARGGSSVDAAELQNLVDRLEVLFVWSHFLADDGAGVPGRLVITDKLPGTGSTRSYGFQGSAWDSFRASRRSSTAIMAPIQYGPSIRSLGWLLPTRERALHPSTQAMAAVEALDVMISGKLPPKLLAFGPTSVSVAEAEALHSAWPIQSPSEAERRGFRELFYDAGAGAAAESQHCRRRASLDLILTVLDQAAEEMGVVDIRRAMASGRTGDGEILALPDALVPTRQHWASLQARQLQRLALESLLRWTETRIDEGSTLSEELAADADDAARNEEDGADASTVGAYLDYASGRAGSEGWPGACGVDGEADIFALMDELGQAQSEDGCARVPGLALQALAYADAMTRALRKAGVAAGTHGALGGQPDRLPLAIASQRLRSARDRSLRSFWTEIIEAWVIGQHVRWSIARNGDGTQRLRIALGDRGWIRLRQGRLSGPFRPTADRLATALALASECGLVERASDFDEEATYIAAT